MINILEQIEHAVSMRTAIRESEGGGGACSLVSHVLADKFHWRLMAGSYTSASGEVICSAHYWNILPDGSIFDATADQFGEGEDVAIHAKDSDAFKRYRMEWYEDWNPDVISDCPQHLGLSHWVKEIDSAQQNRLIADRGDHWWISNRSHINKYLIDQEKHAVANK